VTDKNPTLDYAGTAAKWGAACEINSGNVRIVVPGPHTFPKWVGDTDMAVPLAMIVSLLMKLLPIRRKPRAVVELTSDTLTVTESFDGFERTSHTSWPRAEIAGLRPNRFSRGILLRIPGKVNIDLLTQLPAELIQWIGYTLDQALHHDGQG
jgi:hypothetical protein